MRCHLWVAVLLAAPSAQAFELGLETGMGGTAASNVPFSSGDPSSASPNGTNATGLFAEQSFQLKPLNLDLWGDVQIPMPISVFGGTTAGYLPVDLGLRAGPRLGQVEPYAGAFAQLAILVETPELGSALNAAAAGAGGDVGVDFAIYSFRVGLEARVGGLLSPLQQSGPAEHVWEFLGLLSFRYVFPDHLTVNRTDW